jgi:hypothetical protein
LKQDEKTAVIQEQEDKTMPNKKYWNQVEKAMEFTNALGEAMGEENYGVKDKTGMQEIIEEIKERKAKAGDGPMELITLPGLAGEFKEVAKETRASYRNAKTEEEKEAILNEVLDATNDFFKFLAEEAAEVFGEASNRLREAARENAFNEDEW